MSLGISWGLQFTWKTNSIITAPSTPSTRVSGFGVRRFARNTACRPPAHAREWAARLKRARLAEFPGGRHDILNETVHRQVAAAITDFILTAA